MKVMGDCISGETCKYKCPDCEWVGSEEEMGADATIGGREEMWSNWICPKCGRWHELEDYDKIRLSSGDSL